MAGIPRPHLNKIPGGGMPLAKQENHIKDLTKLTRVELLEIKDRESKLLANKAKLNRLPDKGQRIQNFYNKVLEELERRSNIDDAVAKFSELNIAETGKQKLNQLEWNGTLDVNDPTDDVIDSDDETEMDPLRVIAQRSMHERKTRVLQPEPSLITAEDLEDIKSFSSSDSGVTLDVIDADIVAIDVAAKRDALKPKLQEIQKKSNNVKESQTITDKDPQISVDDCQTEDRDEALSVDAHVRYVVDLVEGVGNRETQREKFKPYKTTISNVHDPEKEKMRKKHKHWEVTAATPPLIQHSGTKLLTLLDSVELQTSYLTKLKELQEKQAAERLAAKIERLQNRNMELPSAATIKSKSSFNTYRNPTSHNIEGEERFDDNDEVHDPLDEERPGGGVTYTVFE